MLKTKLTPLEKYWILYDVGNSAFVLLAATIIPIYFNAMCADAGVSATNALAYWGYAASICTIIVAVLGPVLGSLADTKGYKKPIFTASMMVGVLGCAALSLPVGWVMFLAVFVVAKVGFSASLIFYDSMLTDITATDKLDIVSTNGYAWGYIGSCIPFIISLVIVLGSDAFGLTMTAAMAIAFLLNAVWWFAVTLPLLRHYQQINYIEREPHAMRNSWKRLYGTLKEIKQQKHIFMFLLAFFFYIDGVYTIIDMATAYGESLGLDSAGLLLALLVTQIVAFPCALLFAVASKKYKTSLLVKICIYSYLAISLFAIQLDKQWEFWVLAVFVGMFQGGIQALSRSYYAKIIPPEKSGEYFGLYDIFGKGASFLGTLLIAIMVQITQNQNASVSVLSVMFVIGIFFFHKACRLNEAI